MEKLKKLFINYWWVVTILLSLFYIGLKNTRIEPHLFFNHEITNDYINIEVRYNDWKIKQII